MESPSRLLWGASATILTLNRSRVATYHTKHSNNNNSYQTYQWTVPTLIVHVCQFYFKYHQRLLSTCSLKHHGVRNFHDVAFKTEVLYTWMDLRFSCRAFHDLSPVRSSTETMCMHMSYTVSFKNKKYIYIHMQYIHACSTDIVSHLYIINYIHIQPYGVQWLEKIIGHCYTSRLKYMNQHIVFINTSSFDDAA